MKIKSLTVLIALIPTAIFSQVTIKDAEDFTIGTVLKFQQCDTAGVKPGFTGPKQTWDFSTIKAGTTTVTEEMVKPETTPNGKQFPTANTVEKYSDGQYVYADKENNLSSLVGYVSTKMNMVMEYPKPMVFAKRPIMFGGTNSYPFTDKFTSNNMKFSGKGLVTLAADGYGTLILPNKKYSNVLRVKITQKQTDTLLQNHTVSTMTITTYVWFDEKHKSALFKISTSVSPAYFSKTVEYLISEEDK
ncbi:MAG TPA: hypothetical protein VNZ45_06370 [Bacteroidia bacterium]|jgi:hypothetical protein|nr:hypothetical protein [Bacteroidia bacterium]